MRAAALLVLLAFAAAADASRTSPFRRLLSDDSDGEKEPMYCKDDNQHSDCPEYYECQKLDEKACKSEHVCTTDAYGKQDCKSEEVCWEHECVEVPRYCDPHAQYDECERDYGDHWVCTELDEPVCTYREECKSTPTDKCIEYGYDDHCTYTQGGCKTYDQKKECRKEQFCVEYKQEHKCDNKKVCKAYKQIQDCKPNHKCDHYDQYGKCTRYGQDCSYKQGPCKEYKYEKTNCRYHPTKECIRYDHRDVDCKYVNTHCKEYEQVQKCDRVKGACKKYEHKNECHQVEDVCWKGKCDKKPPPPPKKTYPPHQPTPTPPHKPTPTPYNNGG